MARYELVEGEHFKFWAIRRQGKQVVSSWGRIGSDGQSASKSFASEVLAKQALDQQVARKLREGYQAVVAATKAKPPAKRKPKPAADPDEDVKPVTPAASAAELAPLGTAITNRRTTAGRRFSVDWSFLPVPPVDGEIRVGDPVTQLCQGIAVREPAAVFAVYDRKSVEHERGCRMAGVVLRPGTPVRWQHGFTVGVDSGMFGVWSAGYEPQITDEATYGGDDDEPRVACAWRCHYGDGGYPTIWGLDRNHKQVCLLFGDGVEPGVFGLK